MNTRSKLDWTKRSLQVQSLSPHILVPYMIFSNFHCSSTGGKKGKFLKMFSLEPGIREIGMDAMIQCSLYTCLSFAGVCICVCI